MSTQDAMDLPVQCKPTVSRMMSLRESFRKQSWPSLKLVSFSLSHKAKVMPKMINSDKNNNGLQTENIDDEKVIFTQEELDQQKSIKKYKSNVPTLDWSDTYIQKDIWHTGWNPLAGINVCFKEDYTLGNEKLSIIIERQAMRNNVAFAIGCFFAKDPKTGYMALTYRVKPLHGAEHSVVYYDINYFGNETSLLTSLKYLQTLTSYTYSNHFLDGYNSQTPIDTIFIHPLNQSTYAMIIILGTSYHRSQYRTCGCRWQ